MSRSRSLTILVLLFGLSLSFSLSQAQEQLAASLEVRADGVEMLHVNATNWLPIRVEAVVTVGDRIRTDATGRAIITFFADGTDTEILPNSEYEILRYEGTSDAFTIRARVLAGQTIQRLTQLLDANSSYDIETPGMELVARGTVFAIRVESNGRSAMLVSEGAVDASKPDHDANVGPGFGIRAPVNEALSDVVRATTFAELDAALDGCAFTPPTVADDLSFNVRSGPGRDFEQVGIVAPDQLNQVVGRTETGNWFRIFFRGWYGWIQASNARINTPCAGVRLFPDDYGPEDTARYTEPNAP